MGKTNRLSIVVASLLSSSSLFAGDFSVQFGSTGSENISAIANDELGNIFVAGETTGSVSTVINKGFNDIFVIKYDKNGQELWKTQTGGAGDDRIKSMKYIKGSSAGNGTLYLAGDSNASTSFTTATSSTTAKDIWTTSISVTTGAISTISTKAGTDYNTIIKANDILNNVAISPDGKNMVLVGSTNGIFGTVTNVAKTVTTGKITKDNSISALIQKASISGAESWTRQLDGTVSNSVENATAVAYGTNGIFVAGTTTGNLYKNDFDINVLKTNSASQNGFLVKYNESGSRQFTKMIFNSNEVNSSHVINISGVSLSPKNDRVYILGDYNIDNNKTIFVADFNSSDGSRNNIKALINDNNSSVSSFTVDEVGKLYISGKIGDDIFLKVLDSNLSYTNNIGDLLVENSDFNISSIENFTVLNDGQIFVAGETYPNQAILGSDSAGGIDGYAKSIDNSFALFNLKKGWNLISIDNTKEFKHPNINRVYTFDSISYTWDDNISQPLRYYQGAWIKATKDIKWEIPIQRVGASSVLKPNYINVPAKGWNLLGTNINTTTKMIMCNNGSAPEITWKFSNGTWLMNNKTTLSTFETIYKNEGFWTYCNTNPINDKLLSDEINDTIVEENRANCQNCNNSINITINNDGNITDEVENSNTGNFDQFVNIQTSSSLISGSAVSDAYIVNSGSTVKVKLDLKNISSRCLCSFYKYK